MAPHAPSLDATRSDAPPRPRAGRKGWFSFSRPEPPKVGPSFSNTSSGTSGKGGSSGMSATARCVRAAAGGGRSRAAAARLSTGQWPHPPRQRGRRPCCRAGPCTARPLRARRADRCHHVFNLLPAGRRFWAQKMGRLPPGEEGGGGGVAADAGSGGSAGRGTLHTSLVANR
jgi:hypothetical protein